MAYIRLNWKDEVVEYPDRYTETDAGGGKVTLTPAPGETIQTGTPLSATNFNKMDEALEHLSVAFDMLLSTHQAEIRGNEKRITALEAQLSALANS